MSNRAKEIAAIMATYEPGQQWQWKDRGSDIWIDCASVPQVTALHEPHWNWSSMDYRRKPKPPAPKCRPWTPDEAIGKTVRHKGSGTIYLITSCDSNAATMHGTCDYSYQTILTHYTQLDGSPCGVLETPTTN